MLVCADTDPNREHRRCLLTGTFRSNGVVPDDRIRDCGPETLRLSGDQKHLPDCNHQQRSEPPAESSTMYKSDCRFQSQPQAQKNARRPGRQVSSPFGLKSVTIREAQAASCCLRYSRGLTPDIWRNRREKCDGSEKPTSHAASITVFSGSRNSSAASSKRSLFTTSE